MKKSYETPVAEKIEFCYADQIVASGGGNNEYTNANGCPVAWLLGHFGSRACAALPFSEEG